MNSLAALSLDLFLLGHAHIAAGEAGDGYAFERRVRSYLDLNGRPTADGFRILGRRGLSTMYHQLDEQTRCRDALVVGEWKAYRGQIPQNDLLRFKAVTDDYWLVTPQYNHEPVARLFGGTGIVTPSMRLFAGYHGIILITPDRWPIPALCHPDLVWSDGDLPGPSAADRRSMLSLMRPLGTLLALQGDGSWRTPAMPSSADMRNRLKVWEHWSDRAWSWWDDLQPSRFETLLESRTSGLALSA